MRQDGGARRNAKAMLLATALAIGFALPATAQTDPEVIRDSAGDQIVLPVDGRPGCHVMLATRRLPGPGEIFAATPAPECATRVPAIARARGWEVNYRFVDAGGRTVMQFEEDETALPSSPSVSEPRYYLFPAHPGLTRAPTMANTAGRYVLARGNGRVVCPATLTPARPGADYGALALGKGCPAAGVPRGLTRWSVDGVMLSLFGTGDDDLQMLLVSDSRFDSADDGGLRLTRTAAR